MWTNALLCRSGFSTAHSAQLAYSSRSRKKSRVKPLMTESMGRDLRAVRVKTAVTSQENPQGHNSISSKLLKTDPKHQAKLYEQLVESRSRMSKRLSEANKYVSYLERRMEESNHAMHEAFRVTEKVLDELDALSCLTVTVAASLKFGVDQDETMNKLSSLQKRIGLAQESLTEEKKVISAHCPRKVPVSWIGVAEDVRVMGDFDGWTRGKELSADEISEHVMSEFTGVLELLPGKYQIKFLVNDEWKLASSWPVVTDSAGVTNNLLIVE